MIARRTNDNESRGYDPYNSLDAWNARTDKLMTRGLKYAINHPQVAAEIFARALAMQRQLQRAGAVRMDRDTFVSCSSLQPLNPP